MKISQAFPSNYLKIGDLQGGRHTVEITEVSFEDVGEDKNSFVTSKTRARAWFSTKPMPRRLKKPQAAMIPTIGLKRRSS